MKTTQDIDNIFSRLIRKQKARLRLIKWKLKRHGHYMDLAQKSD